MSETSFATALDTLGEILESDPGRDAIHLATMAVTSDERLFPGQHVGIVDGKASSTAPKLVGIVDPFLPSSVFPGQMFWLVLYPRTITSLRHVWTHPDFENEKIARPPKYTLAELLAEPERSEEDKKAAAFKWIEGYAERLSGYEFGGGYEGDEYYTVTADELIYHAMSFVETSNRWGGDYLTKGGLLEGVSTDPEFWNQLAIYKGIDIPEDKRESFFSCSC